MRSYGQSWGVRFLKAAVTANSGRRGLVKGRWETGRKSIREKCFHTCGSLFSSLKNNRSLWRQRWGAGRHQAGCEAVRWSWHPKSCSEEEEDEMEVGADANEVTCVVFHWVVRSRGS